MKLSVSACKLLIIVSVILLACVACVNASPVADPRIATQPSKGSEYDIMVIPFGFIDTPESMMQISSGFQADYGDNLAQHLTAATYEAYDVSVSVVTNPLSSGRIWQASRVGNDYNNANSVAGFAQYSCYATSVMSGGGISRVVTYMGELQAEILGLIEQCYDQAYGDDNYESPLAGAECIVFLYICGPEVSPISDDESFGVGGYEQLSIQTSCSWLLDDVAFDTNGSEEVACGVVVLSWSDMSTLNLKTYSVVHEIGHRFGLEHPAASMSYGDVDLHCTYGAYDVMRAVYPNGLVSKRYLAYSDPVAASVGWVDVQEIHQSMRGCVLGDIRVSGTTYFVPLAQPCGSDTEYYTWQNTEGFLVAYHSGDYGYYEYPSSGLLVWHLLKTEFYNKITEQHIVSYGGRPDIESAFGKFSDPVADVNSAMYWSDADQVLGRDNLDDFIDVSTGAPRSGYLSYWGSDRDCYTPIDLNADDVYNQDDDWTRAEFSYKTNPSTYGYDYIYSDCVNDSGIGANMIPNVPQGRQNSMVISVKDRYSEMMVLDVLYAPYENVLYPYDGLTFDVGTPMYVAWANEYAEIDTVDVLYSGNGGQDFTILQSGVANDHYITWTPSEDDVTHEGVVRVVYHNSLSDSTFYDDSDGFFEVRPQLDVMLRNDSDEAELDYTGQPTSLVQIDYDGDGYLDMLVCQDDAGQMYQCVTISTGTEAPHYVDKTLDAFVASYPPSVSTGAVFADFDNAPRANGSPTPDIFVTHHTTPRLYQNNGSSFDDVTTAMGLAGADSSWAASWGDFDRDGRMDLYVSRADQGASTDPSASLAGAVDKLYLNRTATGDGFELSTSVSALLAQPTVSSTASWCDYDGDGDQDIFVPALASGDPTRLLINGNNGEMIDGTSAAFPEGVPTGIAAVEWADLDNDGDFDLLLTDQAGATGLPRIFLQDQFNAFYEVDSSLSASGAACMEARVLDIDLDGVQDVLAINASAAAPLRLLKGYIEQTGSPEYFDLTAAADLDTMDGVPRGLVVSDANGDGDPDLHLGFESSAARNYHSVITDGQTNAPVNHWVGLELIGSGANNPTSIGAEVVFTAQSGGETRTQIQRVDGGSGRGGQRGGPLVFGLGSWDVGVQAEIRWPGGHVQTVQLTQDEINSVTDSTNPTVDANSQAETITLIPGGTLTFEITWETDVSSDPTLDRVTVHYPSGIDVTYPNPSRPETVTQEYQAKSGAAGYFHKMTIEGAPCGAGTHVFTVESATQTQTGSTASNQYLSTFCTSGKGDPHVED